MPSLYNSDKETESEMTDHQNVAKCPARSSQFSSFSSILPAAHNMNKY